VRRGILDHAFDGKLTPPEHHAFLSMLLLVETATGAWRGSAVALTTILGYKSRRTMAEALQGLEAGGYILRDFVPGKPGNYPIIIDKFQLTKGHNTGRRIDLIATKRKYGIPDGLIDKLNRKPLLEAISDACRFPILSDRGDDRDDECRFSGDDRGDDRGEVSKRDTVDRREGVEEADSTSPRSDESCANASLPHSARSPIFRPEPTPDMTSAEQLATLFFGYQGRRERFNTPKTFKDWTSTFDRLIRQYGYDDLCGCMHWGFTVDTFWPGQLIRAKAPLTFLEKELAGELMSRYIGSRVKEINAAKAQHLKGNTDGRSKSRSTIASGRGKQPLDNSTALAEAKQKLARRFGTGE
jgi:hypothetical protein